MKVILCILVTQKENKHKLTRLALILSKKGIARSS